VPPDRPRRSDFPTREQRVPESRVAEVIARIREDALAQLRQADIPEQQALAAVERVATFALNAFLTEVEASWTFEALLTELKEQGASDDSQRFADEKAAAFRLQLEAAIAEIAALTIRQIIQDLHNQPPPRDVIEPAPAANQTPPHIALGALGKRISPWLLWPGCLGVWFLLWWLMSGSILWGVFAVGVSAVLVCLFQWVGLPLIGILGLLALILLF
jgi:hypothetical protein